jgi:hypothetical protein
MTKPLCVSLVKSDSYKSPLIAIDDSFAQIIHHVKF